MGVTRSVPEGHTAQPPAWRQVSQQRWERQCAAPGLALPGREGDRDAMVWSGAPCGLARLPPGTPFSGPWPAPQAPSLTPRASGHLRIKPGCALRLPLWVGWWSGLGSLLPPLALGPLGALLRHTQPQQCRCCPRVHLHCPRRSDHPCSHLSTCALASLAAPAPVSHI